MKYIGIAPDFYERARGPLDQDRTHLGRHSAGHVEAITFDDMYVDDMGPEALVDDRNSIDQRYRVAQEAGVAALHAIGVEQMDAGHTPWSANTQAASAGASEQTGADRLAGYAWLAADTKTSSLKKSARGGDTMPLSALPEESLLESLRSGNRDTQPLSMRGLVNAEPVSQKGWKGHDELRKTKSLRLEPIIVKRADTPARSGGSHRRPKSTNSQRGPGRRALLPFGKSRNTSGSRLRKRAAR